MSNWDNNGSGWGGGTAVADSGWGGGDAIAADSGWDGPATNSNDNGGGDSFGMENMDIGAGDGNDTGNAGDTGGDRGCFNCGETG